MQIIRQAALTPSPWKNGGGVTREALRSPPHGDSWAWRLSFAQVDASGPFSDFSGYRRYLVLLGGAGVALQFGDGSSRVLRDPGDLAEFDGGMPTRGELLAGPCADLNLIVAHGRSRAEVRVERLQGALVAPASAGVTHVVVPLDGSATVHDAAGQPVRLGPRDIAIGPAVHLLPDSPCRVFIARITDNSG